MLKEIHVRRPRFNDRQRRRLAVKARKLRFSRLKEIANLATPQTLLRWFRALVAQKYDSSKKRRVGRPRTKNKIAELVVKMAMENQRWGYTRIRDALDNLGHEISRDTVANILRDHGIEPAPERGPHTTWADFLRRHCEVMAASDFFTVEIWSVKGIVRYQVLFVIRLATREVHIAGIAAEGDGSWMEQIARNLTDGFDGFLNGYEFFIHDRDPLFTASFKTILRDEGIKSVRLPKRSPNLNAYAERFVRSIKEECLDQMILFGEKSLRYAIKQYVEHYHRERNHQGLESRIIRPQFRDGRAGEVGCRSRLGGLLNFYCREAA
jgi:transposase InsO family protein